MTGDFQKSKYRSFIINYFWGCTRDAFLDVVADVLDRVEEFSSDRNIDTALDEALIYDDDKWEIMRHYTTPEESTWEDAYGAFVSDIYAIAQDISYKE